MEDDDPSQLGGEALQRWYLRSPQDVENERRLRFQRRYEDFFESSAESVDPTNPRDKPTAGAELPTGSGWLRRDPDAEPSWDQVSPNRWRAVRSVSPAELTRRNELGSDANPPPLIDRALAGAQDGASLIDVGNPANPPLRRQWERREGREWPRDPLTGRNYDVAHIRAKADGGTDKLDNIRPMHPDLHAAEHLANGDTARWGRRPHIARAFGGRVVRGLGILGYLPGIVGLLTGEIRHDTPDNLLSDWFGVPSQEDERRRWQEMLRQGA